MKDVLRRDNGFKIDLQTDHENNVSVRLERYRRQTGHTIAVFTPLFSFTFYASWEGYDNLLDQIVCLSVVADW